MDKGLLIRYIQGDATDREKEMIVTWLDSDSEHMREYLALRKLFDITNWQDGAEVVTGHKGQKRFLSLNGGRLLKSLARVAAIFLVAFLVLRYLMPGVGSSAIVMQTIHVPAGQRAEITLVDGSHVWLNANTTLTFPSRFTREARSVRLRGEGYFDVKTDKGCPFYVKTDRFDVRVWGTEFNVRAYPDQGIFETALLEGSVEILKPGAGKGVFIQPDERLFLREGKMMRAPITHFNHFLWRKGIISFDNEAFPELVKKLELYFDLTIEVRNKRISNYRCTGKFRTKDGVEHILKVLQLSNDFKFKIDDKKNVIVIN